MDILTPDILWDGAAEAALMKLAEKARLDPSRVSQREVEELLYAAEAFESGRVFAQLADGSYRPDPLRRFHLKRKGAKGRVIFIATHRDRVVSSELAKGLAQIVEPW